MMRRLKSILAWRTVADTGVWLYEENGVTRARRACRVGVGHQPRAMDWLGHRTDEPPGMRFSVKGVDRIKAPRGDPAVMPATAPSLTGE